MRLCWRRRLNWCRAVRRRILGRPRDHSRANRVGFLAGYPDSRFRPGQNLTIAETIVSLVNGLQLAGGNPNSLSVYVVRAQIPNFASDEIATATEGKIAVNYPARQKLSPARDITRGEISALIYQTLVATNRTEPINSPYIVSGNWETRDRRTWGTNNQPISPRPCLGFPHSGPHSPTLAHFHSPKS
jgi:hypothetical protein